MTTIVIVGAGIIGCALAKELVNKKTNIHVLEKNARVGEETTSRNSGVIHAGLYYPPRSLKALLCQEGREFLYHWCKEKSIPHKKTGKLIIAAQREDEEALQSIYKNALSCGADGNFLRDLSKQEIYKISPYLKGESALFSTNTGIVDSMALCHSFYADAFQKGAQFHFNCTVKEIDSSVAYRILTNRGDIECDILINCAGLYADEIAALAGIQKYAIFPWRGDYFKISLPYEMPVLIYPAIKLHSKGLGIHLTIDMQSQTFLGPDVEPNCSKTDYSSRPEKKKIFYEAACRLLSGIDIEMLQYERCGIRPKLRSFDSTEEKDFVISQDLPNFFNLVGIESPGLTACLAIAQHVKKQM